MSHNDLPDNERTQERERGGGGEGGGERGRKKEREERHLSNIALMMPHNNPLLFSPSRQHRLLTNTAAWLIFSYGNTGDLETPQ
jgi:hypothetical protein